MKVTEVIDGGAAQKAGMKEGDEIVKVDGTNVGDSQELGRAIRAGEPKKTVTVRRGDKEIELTLTWEEAPAAAQKKEAARP